MALRRTNLMPNLPPADPVAYAAAIAVLVAAALTATAIPAVRASRRDPWAALKEY